MARAKEGPRGGRGRSAFSGPVPSGPIAPRPWGLGRRTPSASASADSLPRETIPRGSPSPWPFPLPRRQKVTGESLPSRENSDVSPDFLLSFCWIKVKKVCVLGLSAVNSKSSRGEICLQRRAVRCGSRGLGRRRHCPLLVGWETNGPPNGLGEWDQGRGGFPFFFSLPGRHPSLRLEPAIFLQAASPLSIQIR